MSKSLLNSILKVTILGGPQLLQNEITVFKVKRRYLSVNEKTDLENCSEIIQIVPFNIWGNGVVMTVVFTKSQLCFLRNYVENPLSYRG